MKIIAYKCKKCGDLVFGRAQRDCRSCSCGNISIDGGLDYCKISYHLDHLPPKTFYVYITATEHELYQDWNSIYSNDKDKYGIIKSKGKKPKWVINISECVEEDKNEDKDTNKTSREIEEFKEWKKSHKYRDKSIAELLELSIENNIGRIWKRNNDNIEMLESFMVFLKCLKFNIKNEIQEVENWIKRLS